jgi:hypothetical protein
VLALAKDRHGRLKVTILSSVGVSNSRLQRNLVRIDFVGHLRLTVYVFEDDFSRVGVCERGWVGGGLGILMDSYLAGLDMGMSAGRRQVYQQWHK